MAPLEADPHFHAFTQLVPVDRTSLTGTYPGRLTVLSSHGISWFPESARRPTATISGRTANLDDLSDVDIRKVTSISDFFQPLHPPMAVTSEEMLTEMLSLLEECQRLIDVDINRLARCAIGTGRLDVFEALVDRYSAIPGCPDILDMNSVLYAAYSEENLQALECIANMGFDGFASALTHRCEVIPRPHPISVLDLALSRYGDPDLLHFCFSQGVDPDAFRSDNNEAIMMRDDRSDIWQATDRCASMPHTSSLEIKMILALHIHFKQDLDMQLVFCGTDVDPSGFPAIYHAEKAFTSLNTIDEDWQRMEMKALHIPRNNGFAVYVAIRRLLKSYPPELEKSLRHVWLQSFVSPPTIPGDQCLSYRAPVCEDLSFDQLHDGGECNFLSFVFPCLSLQVIEGFIKSRETFRIDRAAADANWISSRDYCQTSRTLDEAYYPSLGVDVLKDRNKRQVVSRECTHNLHGHSLNEDEKPILLVSQLWIWLMADTVISALSPPSGQLAESNPGFGGDFWEDGLGIDLDPRTETPELHIIQLLADQVQRFGEKQNKGAFQSPLDIFEIGVVRVLTSVNQYMEKNLATEDSKTELKLMDDIADIRDELAMINEVLRQQYKVLEDAEMPIKLLRLRRREKGHDDYGLMDPEQRQWRREERELRAREEMRAPEELLNAKALIETYRERVNKIDRDAERIDKTVQDRLNVKRTFASIRDSRASMNDAKTSLLLAVAVIGFTVITILFAPLAFMTALFALDIDAIAKHKETNGTDTYYPSGFIVWTFFLAEIATIILTVTIVLCCLLWKDYLTGWAEKVASIDNGGSSTIGSAVTVTNRAAAESAKVRTTGVQLQTEVSSGRTSVLSRQRTRIIDAADFEERMMRYDHEKMMRRNQSNSRVHVDTRRNAG